LRFVPEHCAMTAHTKALVDIAYDLGMRVRRFLTETAEAS